MCQSIDRCLAPLASIASQGSLTTQENLCSLNVSAPRCCGRDALDSDHADSTEAISTSGNKDIVLERQESRREARRLEQRQSRKEERQQDAQDARREERKAERCNSSASADQSSNVKFEGSSRTNLLPTIRFPDDSATVKSEPSIPLFAEGSVSMPGTPGSKTSGSNSRERNDVAMDMTTTGISTGVVDPMSTDPALSTSFSSTGTAVDPAAMEALAQRANAIFFQVMEMNLAYEEATAGAKAAKAKSGQVSG